MNSREFLAKVDEFLERERILREQKTGDYGEGSDAFASVNEIARSLDLPVTKVVGMLLHKHIAAIYRAIRSDPENPSCAAEPLEQRIMDARAYLLLLHLLIQEKGDLFPCRMEKFLQRGAR